MRHAIPGEDGMYYSPARRMDVNNTETPGAIMRSDAIAVRMCDRLVMLPSGRADGHAADVD